MLKCSENTKNQIKKEGSGSYIWNELESSKSSSTNSIIEFVIVNERVERIEQVLRQSLGEAEIIEHFQTFVRFKTGMNVSVGKMFNLLESRKN